MFGKPLQLAFCEERGEKYFLEKKAPVSKLYVYLFANPFSTWALKWQQKQNSKMILLLIVVLWGILTYWLMGRHLIHHKQTILLGSTNIYTC